MISYQTSPFCTERYVQHAGTARALDSNITEKRNTVALLETEREAFLRELMVIKERVDAAKDGFVPSQPDRINIHLQSIGNHLIWRN